MSLNSYRISDFLGGMNLTDSDEEVKVNELGYVGALVSQNVLPISSGQGLASRDGCDNVVLAGTALPSTAVDDLSHRITQLESYPNIIMWSTYTGGLGFIDNFAVPASNTQIQASGTFTMRSEWDMEYTDDSTGTPKIWAAPAPGSGAMVAKKISTAGVSAAWAAFPAATGIIRVWKNRMIVASGDRLYFSNVGDPETFPAGNAIDIKSIDDEDDSITALEVVGENLLVFKNKSVWTVFDSTNFTNRRLFAVGCLNRKATAILEDRVYWVSPKGVYSTDGQDLQLESRKLSPIFFDTSHSLSLTSLQFGDAAVFIQPLRDGRLLMGSVDYDKYLWVGYPRYRDEAGEFPWYLLVNSSGRRMSSAGPVEVPDNASFGIVPVYTWGVAVDPATNLQYIHRIMSPGKTVDKTPSANFALTARGVLGWEMGDGDEGIPRRLLKVITTMKGQFDVDVYKDYETAAASFTASYPIVVGEKVQQVRLGVRGRTHRLIVRGSDFELTEILMKFRGEERLWSSRNSRP